MFAALSEVTEQHLPPNRIFCEWGSGFATATCMAALLGYKAYGIEIEAELVSLSRAIARRLRIPVEIICTSMFPKGYGAFSGVGGAELVQPESFSHHHQSPLRYDGMDIDIADIGLFFAYPWPEERELMQELFDAVAAAEAHSGRLLHRQERACLSETGDLMRLSYTTTQFSISTPTVGHARTPTDRRR